MPIPTPDSGDIITKADIIAMQSGVLDVANALQLLHLARAGLGPDELPSVIVVHDVTTTTANTYVTTEFTTETEAEILATWQDVTNAICDNGGAGYALDEGATIVIIASVRIGKWYESGTTNPINLPSTVTDVNQSAWIAIEYSIDGVPSANVSDSGFIYGQVGYEDAEEWITIVTEIAPMQYSGNVLDYVKVKACTCKGKAGVPRDFRIESATLAFIAFTS